MDLDNIFIRPLPKDPYVFGTFPSSRGSGGFLQGDKRPAKYGNKKRWPEWDGADTVIIPCMICDSHLAFGIETGQLLSA
jgi:hypothetical protein